MDFSRIYSKINRPMKELIPIEYKENGYFVLTDGTMIDMLQIKTKNLTSAKPEEIEYDNAEFARLYKTYPDDLKIIGINFPTNTKTQQAYIRHKINDTANPIYKKHLNEKNQQLIWIEKHNTDREFYLIFFSESEMKYRDNLAIIMKNISNQVSVINDEKKKNILYKIFNKNTSIYV